MIKGSQERDSMRIRKKSFFSLLVFILIMMTASCTMQEVSPAASGLEETRRYEITLEGGTGKAGIQSPVEIQIKDGSMTARLVWTSKNYDYMIVDGIRYDNENAGGNSTFTVPVKRLDQPLPVIGDTVAMSEPHEIAYVIYWGEEADTDGSEEADTDGREEADTDGSEDAGTDSSEDADTDGIGEADSGAHPEPEVTEQSETEQAAEAMHRSGLSETGSLSLLYADQFDVRFFGEYALIHIENSGEYLLTPEGGKMPDQLPEDVVVLEKPLDAAYLVSSSAADLMEHCGALDCVRLSGVRESDWYNEAIRTAMEEGRIVYAGKYRAPDYEKILAAGCDLAIENTMIYHEPAVKEKLEELGIPVLVERSSYETHPLGRLEWIKLYGVLFDCQNEAEAYFDRQMEAVRPMLERERETGKTVVFFHITAGGLVNVRRPGDYITKMIELAGGTYALSHTGSGEETFSSMNMQMEDFYQEAADADILIYNSTIGGEITSVEELLEKSSLFEDFKAVKEGNVYCTRRSLFQQTSGIADFLLDLDAVIHEEDRDFVYLNRLKASETDS